MCLMCFILNLFPSCHPVSVYCWCQLFPTWQPTSESFTNQTPEQMRSLFPLQLRLQKQNPLIKMKLCTLFALNFSIPHRNTTITFPMCPKLIYELVSVWKIFSFSFIFALNASFTTPQPRPVDASLPKHLSSLGHHINKLFKRIVRQK